MRPLLGASNSPVIVTFICLSLVRPSTVSERPGDGSRFEHSFPVCTGAFFLGSHHCDLLQFHLLKSKILCHLDNLIGACEILRIRTELLDAGAKFMARHLFWQIEADPAFTALIVGAEFTDGHGSKFPWGDPFVSWRRTRAASSANCIDTPRFRFVEP